MAANEMGRGLRDFVNDLGSKKPTPAGGAAAAAAVASGVSLLLKVGRITHAAQEPPTWREAEAGLEALVLRALDAIRADCDAFDGVLAASRRGQDGRMAWVRATESPLDLVQVAAQALRVFAPLRSRVKQALAADCGAGAELLAAGISISLANARGNLTSIPSGEERGRLEQASNEGAREAAEALARFGIRLRRPSP